MSAKSLPEHLLEQARHLAKRERTRPRQASLRRALSTAYYALFHFLIAEAVRQIGPNLSEDNYNRVYRWFDHGAMQRVARVFSQNLSRNRRQHGCFERARLQSCRKRAERTRGFNP